MVLIQILLPLYDNDGQRFKPLVYRQVKQELAEKFGGVTVFSRAPAEGLWEDGDKLARDDIVIFEVMVDKLDHAWWQAYRKKLEAQFKQKEMILRAQAIELL